MKNLYPKSKGKVFPSPATLPSDPSLSVLKTLPAAILTLTTLLLLEDLEVLSYLITRSLKTPLISEKNKCKFQKKNPNHLHRPVFDCGCFECYTSFWIRWDSSPNRELIHQVIEAFEEHLAKGEALKKKGRGKNRKAKNEEEEEEKMVVVFPASIEAPALENEMVEEVQEVDVGEIKNAPEIVDAGNSFPVKDSGNNRSLLKKVLVPDVMGLFANRFWNVWSPNV